jgi:hypothetical protein
MAVGEKEVEERWRREPGEGVPGSLQQGVGRRLSLAVTKDVPLSGWQPINLIQK